MEKRKSTNVVSPYLQFHLTTAPAFNPHFLSVSEEWAWLLSILKHSICDQDDNQTQLPWSLYFPVLQVLLPLSCPSSFFADIATRLSLDSTTSKH